MLSVTAGSWDPNTRSTSAWAMRAGMTATLHMHLVTLLDCHERYHSLNEQDKGEISRSDSQVYYTPTGIDTHDAAADEPATTPLSHKHARTDMQASRNKPHQMREWLSLQKQQRAQQTKLLRRCSDRRRSCRRLEQATLPKRWVLQVEPLRSQAGMRRRSPGRSCQ